MTEVLLVLVGVLFAVTIVAAVEYYRHILKVLKEYREAKEVVGDIVLSFNRQLKRQADKLEAVAYKIAAISSESHKALEKAEEVHKRLHTLEPKIGVGIEDKSEMLAKLDRIKKKIRDTVASQEKLADKVSNLERRSQRFAKAPEPKVEAVIPIKREKALAPLTKTELSVLEILALEGTKTAPQVRDRIKLSREHTARLMKKLYEEGYLERDTSKIPFRYWIKEEMEKLLKKTGAKT